MITPQGGWDELIPTSEPESKPAGGTAESLPKVARAASIVAFVLAAVAVLNAPFSGQVAGLFSAPVFLVGGIGIARRRVWSAYGVALFSTAGQLSLLIALLSWRVLPFPFRVVLASSIMNLALMVVFFLGGRSLAAAGAPRGRAAPWIAFTVLLAAFAVSLVWLQPFSNSTGSMEDTLLVGDSILVKRRPSQAPVRGDIIAFRYPVDRRQTFMKRVIGIPGDRIKIVRKMTFVNGSPRREPYAVFKTKYMDSYRDNFPGVGNANVYPGAMDMLEHHVVNGEVVVPARSYFVLGDSRDSSLDSRYWGFVPEEDVIGKPLMIYWSKEPKQNGIFQSGGSIRWNRLFKPI